MNAVVASRWVGTAALLVAVAGCSKPPPEPGKLRLTSVSVTLPEDSEAFPAGAHADLVNANCRSCHSASMVLTQPPLTEEQWQGEVKKMREVYKAPVAEKDVPGIVAYLVGVSDRQRREDSRPL